tara:strand:- start:309 stop:503 length:195 start_codon:yes stop_codon:yes gene_type:complete
MNKTNLKVIFILIPLGFFIYLFDQKISDKSFYLDTTNHFYIIGILIFVVSVLLALIIKIDKDSR